MSKLGAEGAEQALQNHSTRNSGCLGHIGNMSSTANNSAFSALDKAEKAKGLGVAAGDSYSMGARKKKAYNLSKVFLVKQENILPKIC